MTDQEIEAAIDRILKMEEMITLHQWSVNSATEVIDTLFARLSAAQIAIERQDQGYRWSRDLHNHG